MKRNPWKIIAYTLLALVLLLNAAWFGVYHFKYAVYTQNIPKTHGVYLKTTPKYNLSVKKPAYLSFTGNLAIANPEDDLAFVIWPSLVGDSKIGLQLTDKNHVTYSIRVNDQLEYLPKKTDDELPTKFVNQLIRSRRSEIDEMFKYATQYWNL
ncbi:hypothetical protein [Lapidilactobacillus luobeiensis]|uniref:hypothetical protein n=1 Tax=Lapidilactobacillus luobeiensis TaxID=2950371 RepID=UPI0021C4BA22|nr:hypothetical protein [Lapidilactobacillus luobeiensis]